LREQRAHALSVKRFIEEERKSQVERQLKKAGRSKARVELQLEVQEYKKSRVERQREVEEKRKARFANLKPKSYKAAKAFISALSWQQVEQLAVDLLEHKGWTATRTKPGADKSIDAIATKTGENRTAVVQVKDWKNPGSGPVIRETIGAAAMSGKSEVFVITTGRFTTDAWNTAEEYATQSHKNVCELWDGDQLIKTIINMPNDQFINMVISEGKIKSTYQLALKNT
jgi:restriction endonuclease Mrr